MKKQKNFKDVKELKECFEIANLPEAKTVSEIPEQFHPLVMALYEQIVLAKAANTLRDPDVTLEWKNHAQKKYTAWFDMLSSGGVAFSVTTYGCSYACAGDASHLAYIDPNDVRHAFEIAPNVFEDFLTK